jgi:hypothetical protein
MFSKSVQFFNLAHVLHALPMAGVCHRVLCAHDALSSVRSTLLDAPILYARPMGLVVSVVASSIHTQVLSSPCLN